MFFKTGGNNRAAGIGKKRKDVHRAMPKTATSTAPAKENFAALLQESFGGSGGLEGSVLKGTVVSIEGDT
ncbi:MAG: hypothetical protein ACREE7_13100, partial [Dongiaceae bacterium]